MLQDLEKLGKLIVSKKLITRIKGGLGNQLFCYASARRLAWVNQAELVIDDASGFSSDFKYQRKYALDVFYIQAPKASFRERMEPLGRLRRTLLRIFSAKLPLNKRRFIVQNGVQFDPKVLTLRLENEVTYFDGFGQSEEYFADIENLIRQDLIFREPLDDKNQAFALAITSCESVAVHVRWFTFDATNSSQASDEYYRIALSEIRKKVSAPHLFIFSDQVEEAAKRLSSFTGDMEVTYVDHNQGDAMAYADLWLMSKCKHFIIANSTFSWWGAWLGEKKGISQIFAPKLVVDPSSNVTAWGFDQLLPKRWTLL